MGEHAFEAYTLRRIYANVKVCESGMDGIDMNMAVAYHQLGIQVAFGPMVHVCHNQTILGAQDIFTTQNISQCGNKLEISKNTVDRHRQNIINKMQASNMAEACHKAKRLGLVDG